MDATSFVRLPKNFGKRALSRFRYQTLRANKETALPHIHGSASREGRVGSADAENALRACVCQTKIRRAPPLFL
jgi:hypothetical protein